MIESACQVYRGQGPFLALALHNGHDVREEAAELLALDELTRRREEDPFTERWTTVAPTRIIGLRSRFEVDLNRPREKAVYLKPEDAWGLQVWKREPHEGFVRRSLELYDAFYGMMYDLLTEMQRRYGRFLVYDLHSYNHRRNGPNGPVADEETHPQVNVGTRTMRDRACWAGVIESFIRDLGAFEFSSGRLDVRENVKFLGGGFPCWAHQNFPASACVLSVEVKKFFMDEWTGEPDEDAISSIREGLQSTVPNALAELGRAGVRL